MFPSIIVLLGHLAKRTQIFEIWSTLTEKRVPKQYPWGAIATNCTLFSEGCFFPLILMFVRKKSQIADSQIAPLGVLFCHCFLSECSNKIIEGNVQGGLLLAAYVHGNLKLP